MHWWKLSTLCMRVGLDHRPSSFKLMMLASVSNFYFFLCFTTLFSLHYGKSSKALQNIGLVCWLLLQNWWPNKDNSSSQELSFSEEFCQQLLPLLKAMAFGHAHPVGVQSFGGTILCPLYGIQEPSSCFGYPNLELFGKQLRVL